MAGLTKWTRPLCQIAVLLLFCGAAYGQQKAVTDREKQLLAVIESLQQRLGRLATGLALFGARPR